MATPVSFTQPNPPPPIMPPPVTPVTPTRGIFGYVSNDMINAVLRHVYTATGTAISILAILGLSQGDATALGAAVHQIGDGIASIAAGVSALVPIASAVYAAYSATIKSKLKSLDANPEIIRVTTVPGTDAATAASEIPGTKVT